MLKKATIIFFCFLVSACGGITKKTQFPTKPITQLSDIPSACQDSKKKYLPVKSILSKSAYNAKAKKYQPIVDPKGFLSIDFNKDGYPDFHFLERSGKDIRLISCLSSVKRYQRRITPFVVHETIKPDFQTISESIMTSGNSLVLTISRHEHNWGSDTEISAYGYNKTKNEFLLTSREITSNSGDGMRSDTFEFYDLKNNRYKSTGKCGALEEGCRPYTKSGRIAPLKKPATLLRNKKIYTRLLKK